jgi:hypothetical protein
MRSLGTGRWGFQVSQTREVEEIVECSQGPPRPGEVFESILRRYCGYIQPVYVLLLMNLMSPNVSAPRICSRLCTHKA